MTDENPGEASGSTVVEPKPAEPKTATSEETERKDGKDGNEDRPSEEYGSRSFSQALLDGAANNATESNALDATLKSFGYQTNQQINNYYGGDRRRSAIPTVVAEETLGRIRTVFIAPRGYAELWDRVEDRNLVILTAPAGCGRRHAALHVLDAVCDGRVHELSGPSVAELHAADLAENTGYLWTDRRGAYDDSVEPQHVERVVEALRRRNSRMIIVSQVVAKWSFELADHRCELTGPPELTAVVERYLTTRSDQTKKIRDLLRQPSVVDALTRLSTVEGAAQLGTGLLDAMHGRVTVDRALARAEAMSAGMTDWFGSLQEPQDQALALALGTLDGLAYPTVMAAARDLEAASAEGRNDEPEEDTA